MLSAILKPVSHQRRTAAALLFSVHALLTAGLVAYSQTKAFAWDEGFHILAAQLIRHGKRPYIDFVHSQTPLNAYWNAGWMAVFGESWRVPHAAAALCSAGAVILTSGFVYSRFPMPRWRLPGALMAGLLVGLNVLVMRYGGIAQAYGLCLLAVVAAWRLAVRSAERQNVVSAGLAGLACGIAAASSLLTAPASPVVLIWILAYSQPRLRWAKFGAFILGNVAAFVPVLWLFVQGPRQVFFGIIQYNALYRQLDWSGALGHNFEVAASWIDYGPALLLLLLAAGGLLFVWFRSDWDVLRKGEFYLCGWLSIAFAVYISSVLPTFPRYYVFAVPFLAVLAVAGLHGLASSLSALDRPWPPVLVLTVLLSLGLAKLLYEERDDMAWSDLEMIAAKVNEVTTPEQTLFADEAIYFLTRHAPPSGIEMENSHKFNFPEAQLTLLHLIPQGQLDKQIKAGAFHTLETCRERDDPEAQGYAGLYSSKAEFDACAVYWDQR